MKYYAFLNRALARFFAVLATFTLIVSLVPVHVIAFSGDDNNGNNSNQQGSHGQQDNNNHNNGDDSHSNGDNGNGDNDDHHDDHQQKKGQVTVSKVIVGDDSVQVSDFILKVGNKTVQSGDDNQFDSDTYTVSETPKNGTVPTNYVASFSGDCDSDGSITVSKDDNLNCTITNTYTQPTGSITIIKDFNGQAPSHWSFDFSGDLGDFSLSNGSSETTFSDKETGTYNVTEDVPSQGWKTPTVNCVSENENSSFESATNGETIALAAGDDVTCTFTNEQKTDDHHDGDNDDHHQQTIQGCKFNDENNNGVWDDNETTLSNWGIELVKTSNPESVVDSTTTDENGCYSFTVDKGDWTVREVQQDGWTQTAPEIGMCEFDLSGSYGNDHHFTFKKDDKHSDHRYNSDWGHSGNGGDQDNTENVCDFGNYQPPQETPVCESGDNLLTDGSFESPVGSDASGWDIFASGTSGLSWLVSWVSSFVGAPETANIELHHGVNGWTPSDGSQYAELDSDWGGPSSDQTGEEASTKISQIVTTEPGATYELRYDFSPRPQTGSDDNVLDVQAGDTTDTRSADGSSNSQTAWNTYYDDFIATGTQSVIAFADGGTPNSVGTFIDNAVLCKVKDAPVPQEPVMCTMHIVSNTADQSQEADGDASLVSEPYHVNWTAVVGDGAKWIWSMDPITDPVGTTSDTFTKSFNWNGTVDSASLTIAADNSYVAKVNGTTAASNATEFNYAASTVHDVASLVHTGSNDLSFNVTNWSLVGGTAQTNPGGLIYDLTVTGENASCDSDGGTPTDGGGSDPVRHTLSITTTGDGDGVITSNDEDTAIDCDSTNPEETTCEATFDEGTDVNLHVVPNEGSNFDHTWAVGAGTCTGNNTSCTVTMGSDIALTAHFDLNDPVVTTDTHHATHGGSGTKLPLLNQFGVGGGDTFLPTGQVLGASTTTIPVGAPNTGEGGTSRNDDSIFASLVTLLSILVFAIGTSTLRRS